MKHYCKAEIEILKEIADASLTYGEVELRITTETVDGELIPEILIRKAPDAVIRRLMEDNDRVVALDLDYDGLHIFPFRRYEELLREAEE